MKTYIRYISAISAALLSLSLVSEAEVRLPSILGNNMVLQRNTEVNLWGSAAAGKTVTVETSWNGEKYRTKAGPDGRWSLKVATSDAGGPYSIVISDGEKLVLDNILLGEVWICGGQSNMEMPMCGFMFQPVENSVGHIVYSASETPDIRLFTVPRTDSAEPLDDCESEWLTSLPENVSNFSAVGYLFGKALTKAMGGIPVGLVSSNYGGSRIECWMPEETVAAIEGIDQKVATGGTGATGAPGRLYNAMIHPVRNFTAKGFIWYQGCSNRLNWYDYKKLMIALVKCWREEWGNEKMPFYYTQLAPYEYDGADFRALPLVVEAQYQALSEIPYSGIAATTDVGNKVCIHPSRKFQVAERLAWLALANDYGYTGVPRPAPTYKEMEIVRDENRGNMAVLGFNNLSNGGWSEPDSFKAYENNGYCSLGGFEIAGADRVWHKAHASLRWWENRIEVWSEAVEEPVAVRYAFRNFPAEASVMTTMGQPLAPFRTDDWPVDDIGRTE